MRKRYSAAFKAQVVLELLKEEKTINQLAAEHGVHPTQLRDWKKQALDSLPDLFEQSPEAARMAATQERERDELFAQLGRLTTPLAWLKKIWPRTSREVSVWPCSMGRRAHCL